MHYCNRISLGAASDLPGLSHFTLKSCNVMSTIYCGTVFTVSYAIILRNVLVEILRGASLAALAEIQM